MLNKVSEEKISNLLKNSKTIAAVGISEDSEKYAHKVPGIYWRKDIE
jgi:predicted CoA-binding protein